MYHTHVCLILSAIVIIINWQFKLEDEDLDLLAAMHIIKSENIQLDENDPIMKNEKLNDLWIKLQKENYSYDFDDSEDFASNILEIDEIMERCSTKKSENASEITKTEDTESISLHLQNDTKVNNN